MRPAPPRSPRALRSQRRNSCAQISSSHRTIRASPRPSGRRRTRGIRRHERSTRAPDRVLIVRMGADAELVRRCLGEEPGAWDELVLRYSRYVYAIAAQGYRLQGADAEDAFQDVFLRVYDRLGSLRNADALRPWIAQLTRRGCLHPLAKTDREEPAPVPPPGIGATNHAQEQAVAVREALC